VCVVDKLFQRKRFLCLRTAEDVAGADCRTILDATEIFDRQKMSGRLVAGSEMRSFSCALPTPHGMSHAVATPAALARAVPCVSTRGRFSRVSSVPRRNPARRSQSRVAGTAGATFNTLSSPVLDASSANQIVSSTHEIASVAGDVFAETGVGPVLCVVCTVFIGYVVFNGYATIKQLKEELTGLGYDVNEFNKVGELRAIKRAVEAGTVDGIFDKVWYQRAVMSTAAGSIVDVQKVQAYWKKKGVNVKTLADLDKITNYMIKKYGAGAKM
jgi:hypothetical protein